MRTTRLFCGGFEHGDFYATAPSDGNVTVTSGAARTGGYGARVNGQSGVRSYAGTPTNLVTSNQLFYRAFIRFDALPSTARYFLMNENNPTAIAIKVALKLKPTGKIALERLDTGGSVSSSVDSVSSIVPNRWYQIELGFDDTFASLKIDGNVEIDWTSVSTIGSLTTIHFGVIDSVAAALAFDIDDIATDSADWVGYGRVKRVPLLDLVVDNAAWTATGAATKLDAVQISAGWNDSSYIQSGSAGTGTRIMFGTDPMPTDAVQIYGMQLTHRQQRVTTGAITTALGWRGSGQGEYNPTPPASAQSNNSVAVTTLSPGALTASSPFGSFFPEEFWDEFLVGFQSTSGTSKVFGFVVEVDYSDRSTARLPDNAVILADFEGSIGELQSLTNSALSGSATAINTDAVFGSGCLSVSHAASGRSFIRTGLPTPPNYPRLLAISGWVKLVTAPTGSQPVAIFFLQDNVTFLCAADVRDDGSVRVRGPALFGSASPWSAAGVMPVGVWTHIGWEVIPPTVASSRTDGRMRLWVNDEFILEYGFGGTATIIGSSILPTLGQDTNLTTAAVLRYDGIVMDRSVRHTSHLKFKTLTPAGVSTLGDNATFTAVGDTQKWQCLDEFTPDDDTTYVLTPATSVNDYYDIDSLPANAVNLLNTIALVARARRDSGTVSSFTARVIFPHTNGSKVASGNEGSTPAATYLYPGLRTKTPFPLGQLTPAHVNAMEIGAGITGSAHRITWLRATVAYTAYNERPSNRGGSGMMVG